MPRSSAWHSLKKDDKKVHHTNTNCPEGSSIEQKDRASGDGGYPLCNRCSELNRQGK